MWIHEYTKFIFLLSFCSFCKSEVCVVRWIKMYTGIINDDILPYTFFAIYYRTTLYIYIYRNKILFATKAIGQWKCQAMYLGQVLEANFVLAPNFVLISPVRLSTILFAHDKVDLLILLLLLLCSREASMLLRKIWSVWWEFDGSRCPR